MKAALQHLFRFEAAHRNLSASAGSSTARLHGHSYEMAVIVSGPVSDGPGWVVDFAEIRTAASPILSLVDHRLLNDVTGITDSSLPDLRRWFSARLADVVPEFAECTVRILGDVTFDPVVRRITQEGSVCERVCFGFPAAHFLPRVPEAHKCRRVHGHSFGVEIDSFDSAYVLGQLSELYDHVDHRLLNDVSGLDNPTSENLAQWFWTHLSGRRSRIAGITIRETCTAACVIRGND